MSPLPGTTAQREMAPRLGDIDRFRDVERLEQRPGGVLILLYEHKGTIHLPLMARTEYDGPHSGQISFPGGKMEQSDRDIVWTALRESNEELGIDVEAVEVLGMMTELSIIPSNFAVQPVVGYSVSRPDFRPDEREVKEIIEVPVDHLLDPRNVKSKPITVRGDVTLQAPYYDVFGHTVWGATAMMLSEFLTVYKDL